MRDEQISIVTFYWDNGTGEFQPEHINRLAKMVKEHLFIPYRFVCVYDIEELDVTKFNEDIELIPLPESARWAGLLVNPTKPSLPSSYRRLWAFSEKAKFLGDRILLLDIDCLIVRDLLPLFEYSDADFVGWRPCSEEYTKVVSKSGIKRIGGGTWLLRTGTHTEIWDNFTINSLLIARKEGWRGSDQAWLCYNLAATCEVWPYDMGIYHTQDTKHWKAVPEEARIIHFNGQINPWEDDARSIKWYCDFTGLPYDSTLNSKQIRKRKRILKNMPSFLIPERIIEKPNITFVLFWWDKWPNGDLDLGKKYIINLVNGIKRNVPEEFEYSIVLFTDQLNEKFEGVEVKELKVPQSLRWNLKKMYMYSGEAGLSNPVLCLDLDCIITGNLSPLIDRVLQINRKHLITCQGAFHRKKMGGSIIGFLPRSSLGKLLWNPIVENRAYIEKITKGSERVYYQKRLQSRDVGFWEKYCSNKVLSYKRDCKQGLPEGSAIVRFHGNPRPHEVWDAWIKEYWNGSTE